MDSAFSASSEFRGFEPLLGRLGGATGWCAGAASPGHYLQVDLGSVYQICSVVTQGVGYTAFFVKSYELAFSTDGQSFHTAQAPDGGTV